MEKSYIFYLCAFVLKLHITTTEAAYKAIISNPELAKTYSFKIKPWDGESYRFVYETTLGTLRVEEGYLEKQPDGNSSIVVIGFDTYIGENDRIFVREYYADESGFHPSSAYLLSDGEQIKRFRRMIELVRKLRDASDALAGDVILNEEILGKHLNEMGTLDKIKARRAARKSG